ncbi:MAG: hypothetical protein EOO65_00820 [Methanosarcinales archaeon]|nr:MAG: hypothetical protein EOO65_00820 [Methanosarcinales archaeon]
MEQHAPVAIVQTHCRRNGAGIHVQTCCCLSPCPPPAHAQARLPAAMPTTAMLSALAFMRPCTPATVVRTCATLW